MAELEEEIVRLKKIHRSLRRDRTALHKLSESGHQNTRDLARCLPAEILGKILIISRDIFPGGMSIAPTLVCRYWREVALATTELWNYLNIPYPSKLRWEPSDASMLQTWLKRSGCRALTISVGTLSSWAEDERNPDLDAILHSHAHRWKDVKLIVAKSMLSFFRNIPGNLPILHTLHIDGPECTKNISLNNLKYVPALRIITLDRRICPIIPDFPWDQLTECNLLRGGRYTCQDGYRVLSRAINLQAFTIELNAKDKFSGTPPPRHIHLEKLLALTIFVLAGSNAHHIVRLLTLPALTEIKVLEDGFNDCPEYLEALITRSSCQLKKLSIGTRGPSGFAHGALHHLFTITPWLCELELWFFGAMGVDQLLMNLLTHQPYHAVGSCCLLPRLASIKSSVHIDFSYERFAEFLSSRLHATTCTSVGVGLAQLRQAVLMTWEATTASGRRARHLPMETYEEFRELRDSGLDLYVTTGNSRHSLEDYFSPGNEEDDIESQDEWEDEWEEEQEHDDHDDDDESGDEYGSDDEYESEDEAAVECLV